MDTNSNSYIIIYSAVMVVIVAFLLAFIFQALKPMQDANVALDKKKQILAALNIRDLDNVAAAARYSEVVVADRIIAADGSIISEGSNGGENAGFRLNSADYKAGKLALYICKVDGQTKYVIPVYGMGLWGPIWGYIAVNDDKNTIMAPTSIMTVRRPASVLRLRTTSRGRTSSRARRFSAIRITPIT